MTTDTPVASGVGVGSAGLTTLQVMTSHDMINEADLHAGISHPVPHVQSPGS